MGLGLSALRLGRRVPNGLRTCTVTAVHPWWQLQPPTSQRMEPGHLSARQRQLFADLGFLLLRSHLDPREVRTLSEEGHAAIDATYERAADGSYRRDAGPAMGPSRWTPLLSPSLCPLGSTLLEDPRFHGVASTLFEDQPAFFPGKPIGLNAGLLLTSADTGWHRVSCPAPFSTAHLVD